VVGMTGLEPASCGCPDRCSRANRATSRREPHAGIEPAFSAWKADTLAVVLVRQLITRATARSRTWTFRVSAGRSFQLSYGGKMSEAGAGNRNPEYLSLSRPRGYSRLVGKQGLEPRPPGPGPGALTLTRHPVGWTTGGSNPVPPVCRIGALPYELAAHVPRSWPPRLKA
jgi:hypothetical protein